MIRIAAIALMACLALAGCEEEEDPGQPLIGASRIEAERTSCIVRGGKFEPGGRPGTMVCYMPTRDANKRCKASSDCEGLCLARSGTCAPVQPLFGCQDVLTDRGGVSRLCFE